MSQPGDAIEASFATCRRLSRQAGSSFYAGFLLLPAEKRRAMDALYAFMRHTDDLADAQEPADVRREALRAWRADLHRALDAPQSPTGPSILPALAETVRRYRIPRRHLDAVIDGVEMDLDVRRYETFEQLQVYCERVASDVGLACIHIWGFRGFEAFEPARQAGIALQLTNILRDLREDAQAGRIYLPLADLEACGYSADDLLSGVDNACFRRLMDMEIARAKQCYREAAHLLPYLSHDGRRIFGLMLDTYRAILDKIARRPEAVLQGRVRLGRVRKTRLLARWAFRAEKGIREWGSGIRKNIAGAKSLSPNSPTVAIVGGGLAGLAAAAEAVERGWRIELFERADALGGRAGSLVDAATGRPMDYCQHVAMGCCREFLDFCRRTGVDDCFSRSSILHFIAPDGTQCDFAPSRWLPSPVHLLPGLLKLRYLSLGERWGIVRALGKLAGGSPLIKGDGTIGQWLHGQGQSERAVELFWSPVVVGALSETVERASLSAARKVFCDGLMASRRAGELVLPRRPLGEIFHERVGGRLADRGVQVHLNTPVRRVDGDRHRVEAIVLDDGTRRAFDAVVVAVPWQRVKPLFDENLQAAIPRLASIDGIEPAAITAVHLWFDRPIMPLSHAVLVGRLGQWVFASQACSSPPYHCQVVLSASHRLPARSHEELVDDVRRELEAIWPAGELLHSRVVVQAAAVFSYVPAMDRLRPPQETSIENLALAGDWTATGWPATMESAVLSGRRAMEVVVP